MLARSSCIGFECHFPRRREEGFGGEPDSLAAVPRPCQHSLAGRVSPLPVPAQDCPWDTRTWAQLSWGSPLPLLPSLLLYEKWHPHPQAERVARVPPQGPSSRPTSCPKGGFQPPQMCHEASCPDFAP